MTGLKGMAIVLAVALLCPQRSEATLGAFAPRIVSFISSFLPDFSGRVQIDDKLFLFGPNIVGEPVPEPIPVPEPVPVPTRPYPIPIPVPELPIISEGHAYEPVQSGYDVSPGQAYPPHFLSYSEPGLGRDLQFAIPADALVPQQFTQEELRNLQANVGVSVGGSSSSSSGYGSSGYGYDQPQLKEEELRNINVGAGVAIGGPVVSSGYGYNSPQVKEEVVRNLNVGADVTLGGPSGYGYSAGPIREEVRNIQTSVSVGGQSGYGNSPQVKEEIIEEVIPSQEKVEVVQEHVEEPAVEQKTEIVDQVVETGPIEHVKEEVHFDQEPIRVTEHVENNMVETVSSPSSPNIFRNLPKAPVTFRKQINTIN